MVNRIIKRWNKAQTNGLTLPCPRCGNWCMSPNGATKNALSRRADIYICDSCGNKEAIEDIPGNCKKNIDDWFAIKCVLLIALMLKMNLYQVLRLRNLSDDDFDVIILKIANNDKSHLEFMKSIIDKSDKRSGGESYYGTTIS